MPTQAPSHRRLPDFLQSVNLKYMKLGYHCLITHFITLLLFPLMAVIVLEAGRTDPDDLCQLWLHLLFNLVSVLVLSAVLVFGATHPRPIYLIDFACYKAPAHLKAGFYEFQRKIMERSGERSRRVRVLHVRRPRQPLRRHRGQANCMFRKSMLIPNCLFRVGGSALQPRRRRQNRKAAQLRAGFRAKKKTRYSS